MAGPALVAAGAYLAEASGASAAFAVPAGVASGHVVLVVLYKENTGAVTPPAGFTEKSHQAATGTQDHDSYVFWKRATGADSGTYSFSWTGSVWRTGFAAAYSGCATTGDPVDVFAGATSGSTAVTASPAVAVTTTGADRLLVWFGATWDVTAWTTPSGFTVLAPSGAPSSRLTTSAYKAQAVAGASGSITTTTTQSFTKTAHLLALLPPAGTVYAKTGGAARLGAGSGPKAITSATVYNKTGGGARVGAGSGAKLVGRDYAKTGGGAGSAAGSGAKVVNASNPKTGGATAPGAVSGPKVVTHATVYAKTGGAVRFGAVSGAKTVTSVPPLPSAVLDLSYWHLTTPEDSGDGTAEQIDQPALASYSTANFFVESSTGWVKFVAPVNGFSTSAASGATREELRQHRKSGYALAAMDPTSSGRWQMTVTTHVDPSDITGGTTPRKEMVCAQIHGAGDSPIPLIIAAEYHVSPTRIRIYKNGPGLANPVTDITPDTPITIRMRLEGGSSGRLKLWVINGEASDLPAVTSTAPYDWPISDFTDQVGWYFKTGAYNKTTISSGSTGEAIARISYLQVLEPADADPAPGTTYVKTGGAAVRGVGSGAKVLTPATIYVKTGGAARLAAGSGAKSVTSATTYSKTGGAPAVGSGSGAKVLASAAVYAKTGGAAGTGAVAGPRALTSTRGGSAAASAAGVGTRSFVRARTGGATRLGAGSGPKAITSATVYVKAGSAATTAVGSGERDTSVVHARTGGATASSAVSGAVMHDVATVHAKAGAAAAPAAGAGARDVRSSTTYNKTGGAAVLGSVTGSRQRVRVYTGGATATATGDGHPRHIQAATYDCAGGAAVQGLGSGAAVVETPPGYEKSGGGAASGTGTGRHDVAPAAVLTKAGGGVVTGTGIALFEIFEPQVVEKEGGAAAVGVGAARRRVGGRLRAGMPIAVGQMRAGLAVRR